MTDLRSRLFPPLADSRVSGTSMQVLIIGAGTSGIAAARELDTRGIEYRIVESSSEIGGIWRRTMHPASYPGLLQNTAPDLTVFERPALRYTLEGTHFTRDEYATYLQDYVTHCDIERHVLLGARATAIVPGSTHVQVDISVETEERLGRIEADHVVYAGGLHHRPAIPDIPGMSSFVGDVRHSSEIKNLIHYRQKRVLLVGIGNTSADLAVFLKGEAGSDVHLSCRSNVWIVPREIDATPIDAYCQALRRQSPPDWQKRFRSACLDSGAAYFGGPEGSDCIDFSQSRITVSTELIRHLATGSMTVHARVACIDGNQVFFNDGSRASFDSIIFCTGYDYCPIDSDPPARPTRPLIGNVRNADHPIWYIGAPAVWGGSPRLAQYQGRLAAHAIHSGWNAARLREAIHQSRFSNYKRATSTVGPGLEIVDFHDYQNLVNDLCGLDQ